MPSSVLMRNIVDKERWYFVDEAGDPTFYGKGKKIIVGTEGCSKTFSLGYVRISDPQIIRAKLAEVRLAISTDRYLRMIPSWSKSMVSFHATDDCPEVRYLVYRALQQIDFRAQVIVARKREDQFRNEFNCSETMFYDKLIKFLFVFGNQFHIAEHNNIVFAERGSKARQHALREAVNAAVARFRRRHRDMPATGVSVSTSRPLQEPSLQAADYVLWSVQRAYEKGEMRYFDCLREKIQIVWDVYDFAKMRSTKRWVACVYNEKRNPFDISETSPLS